MQTFPARLHIILARNASTAIVIRRGPSAWSTTFGWDRNGDGVRLGQWLHGRIYERRCDLSPDGKHFTYFAMNGQWQSESRGSWSAISNAPYLKALGFWPKGDCWHGGGLFLDNRRFWLNGHYASSDVRRPGRLQQVEEAPFEKYWGGECTGVYYPRLLRDGWEFVAHESRGRFNEWTVFEKALSHGWRLVKTAHETIDRPEGKGCYYDEHELLHADGEKFVDGKTWEWADWDPVQERLVWTAEGCLYGARLGNGGLMEERLIHDFNPYRFEPVVAPY